MKSLKTLLSLFAVVAVFSAGAFAQPDNDDITASAEVLSAITVTGDQNLDFGTFADGGTASQAITGGNEANLGRFSVTTVSTGADVDFALNTPLVLTAAGSFDDLPYAATAVLDTDTDVSTGTTAFTLNGSGDGTVNQASTAQSTYYVYVGGTVDASNGAEDYSGSYSGTINLSVTYN